MNRFFLESTNQRMNTLPGLSFIFYLKKTPAFVRMVIFTTAKCHGLGFALIVALGVTLSVKDALRTVSVPTEAIVSAPCFHGNSEGGRCLLTNKSWECPHQGTEKHDVFASHKTAICAIGSKFSLFPYNRGWSSTQ